ncbi:histidinol-phosphatase [Roseicyclus sp. F158]|uniref:Histidinol-phosphatase n=1 Tax=Tropicimonas omnivorans TaxID=3075590 RepID=A0ABU3DGY5_9RHOB|nr:histidinol-phosphatase [Roseicyclus sp. F158]MDT0682828.1 histidinol-phosphatase [Roseicyclus sp. F158]
MTSTEQTTARFGGAAASSELRRVAAELAEAARGAILPYFRAPGLVAESKEAEAFDPVTAADRAAETAMRDILDRRRPQDGIHGEEFGKQEGTSGLTWVLDPIDGTRAFLAGTPSWGVLIALSDEAGPIFGIIDQPFTSERWEGAAGLVATHSGPQGTRDLCVRRETDPAGAILMTTFPEVGSPEDAAAFARVARDVKLTRYGLDCYAYGLVALGQIDLVIEAGLKPYDICAPIAVIEAAGGIVTDWEGGPAHEGGRAIAAATPELHAWALERLADGTGRAS